MSTENQYRVEKNWSQWTPGTVLKDSELPPGLDIQQSISRGTISPLVEGEAAWPKPDDYEGWKNLVKALQAENLRLRTATPSAETLSELDALRAEHEALKGEHESKMLELSQYQSGSVSKESHKELQSKFNQLEAAYNGIQAEKKASGKKPE